MKTHPRNIWEARTPRERVVLATMTAALGIALYGWLIVSGTRAQQKLQANVQTLQAQSNLLHQQAVEIKKTRNAPALPASQTDLRLLLQAQTEAVGLSRQLVKIDTAEANRAEIAFNAVAFPEWLQWLSGLERHNIRLDSGQIEALPDPGMVSVTATLIRAAPR